MEKRERRSYIWIGGLDTKSSSVDIETTDLLESVSRMDLRDDALNED